MSGLVFDQEAFVQNSAYQYENRLHSKIAQYNGMDRTLVDFWNPNDNDTTTIEGIGSSYEIIGPNSGYRFDLIENLVLFGISEANPEESSAAGTGVRNMTMNGTAVIGPQTIMPRENAFFVVKHVNMNHLFRVTQVSQDGLNTDGSYKISWMLYSTNPETVDALKKQVVNHYVAQKSVGGQDEIPALITKDDHTYRKKLIRMVNDMIDNYVSRYYDVRHNCFIYKSGEDVLFDACGNTFMARNNVLIKNNSTGNIILNENKLGITDNETFYQRSPFKWVERDCPLRYIDYFKYRKVSTDFFYNSSFYRYNEHFDVIEYGLPYCEPTQCDYFFPIEVMNLLEAEVHYKKCFQCKCCHCGNMFDKCSKDIRVNEFTYVGVMHDFIHGKLKSIYDLSLFTGDQLFDNMNAKEIYLWTPIVIYILKKILSET